MAVNRKDSFKIDINCLVSSIEDMMIHDLLISPKCSIFKTPTILYRHNEKAYIPDAFFIGPLHHGRPYLKAIEKIKVKYLQGLISRSRSYYPELLRTLINSIMEVEKEAREYYAEAIDYNPEELVKILVIDGCFLIELFRRYTYWGSREVPDPIFSKSCMLQFLFHDLILLENQVPWMVLEILFDLTWDSKRNKSLIELGINFFESMHFSKKMPPRDQISNIKNIKHFVDLFMKISALSSTDDPQPGQCINIQCIKHFVDLFRKLSTLSSTDDPQTGQCINIQCIKHFVDLFRKLSTLSSTLFRKLLTSSSTDPQSGQCINIQCIKYFVDLFRKLSTSSSILFSKLSTLLGTPFRISSAEGRRERSEFIPSATSLMESGVKFKKATSFENVLDVKFKDGVLEIPPFQIEETTETSFRNLISYEQCYPYCKHRITSYAVLLDSLINIAKDIDILCKYGIIENWLNPEDAAQLFNKLYHDTCVAYTYSQLTGRVNEYCQRRLPRWRAVLMGKYFNTPWAGISTLAAIILLIMTFLQTLYSMKK